MEALRAYENGETSLIVVLAMDDDSGLAFHRANPWGESQCTPPCEGVPDAVFAVIGGGLGGGVTIVAFHRVTLSSFGLGVRGLGLMTFCRIADDLVGMGDARLKPNRSSSFNITLVGEGSATFARSPTRHNGVRGEAMALHRAERGEL
jgi:hypothetical protein